MSSTKQQILHLKEAIAKCTNEVNQLTQKFFNDRAQKAGATQLGEKEAKVAAYGGHRLGDRKTLTGHHGKIYALQWCKGADEKLVSASQDGKLIIWNAITTNKTKVVPLASAWVMTVAYSDSGEYVACGGLDNACSIYKLSSVNILDEKAAVPRPQFELSAQHSTPAHDGYLSSCKFLSDQKILTASGDQTCMLWDIAQQKAEVTFKGHEQDVNSISVSNSQNVFVSGSCDTTAKIWDIRTGKCVQTFMANEDNKDRATGHEGDVNAVNFFPDGQAFATAGDDSRCFVYDMRSWSPIATLQDEKVKGSFTSCAFSGSGRLLFAGYEANDASQAVVWDIMRASLLAPLICSDAPGKRVSCLDVNRAGTALATGCWDERIKIWA